MDVSGGHLLRPLDKGEGVLEMGGQVEPHLQDGGHAVRAAPQGQGGQERVVGLEDAGLDGLIVENVGDTPFFRESVPTETVAGRN